MPENRPLKGQSLLCFPHDFTVIDIETTGVRPALDEILEISALRFRALAPAEQFSVLVHPSRRIPAFITQLTGITNRMVQDAPEIADAAAEFAAFIGDDVLMGWNVNFDINFLYDKMIQHCGIPLSSDFVDVLRFARRALPQLESRKQTAVAAYYGISAEGAHRALRDCEICGACYLRLMQEPALQNIPHR